MEGWLVGWLAEKVDKQVYRWMDRKEGGWVNGWVHGRGQQSNWWVDIWMKVGEWKGEGQIADIAI